MHDGQKYLFAAPDWTEIAKAARAAIRAVKADFPEVGDIHLAADMGADSAKTIERLERMETKKVPASLFAAIGRKYGEQYVKAYRDLMMPGGSDDAINALPAIASLMSKLAVAAKDGRGINHISLGDMLPELRAAGSVISALQSKAHQQDLAG